MWWSRYRPRSRWSTSAGTRRTPTPAGPGGGCRRRPSGRRRPGSTRPPDGRAATRGATPTRAPPTPTWASAICAPPPPGPIRRAVRRWASGSSSATCGSGRRATSCRTRGSRRSRTASTRRSSSATPTRCCAAGRSGWTRSPAGARSATGTCRCAARSSPGSAPPGTPPPARAPRERAGAVLMCRHLAYVGPALPLGELVSAPEHSLFRQSWAPRHQRYGTVNADGFGLGWYAPGDPVPARYRRAGPIWADPSFGDLARVVRSTALLAAVRDATAAGADPEAAVAPYADGPWLFSHNGAVAGWPESLAKPAASLEPLALLELESRCDAALVWALVRDRLRRGEGPGDALGGAVRAVAAAAPGSRLNLLLTDGRSIAATTWGDTLFHRPGPAGGRVVASEPYDDEPGWRAVPDRTLLLADAREVTLLPLKEPSA
ncbi:conserved hypothetical protein [Streptomyces albidoflavus]|nr:conserved hypothetical protein [Streptomyces albidoflavus]